MYDLIIIGAGPAGLGAAIYASRAKLNVLVLEKEPFGGSQILNTDKVDNYPGFFDISGFELGMRLREHAQKLEVPFVVDEAVAIGAEEKMTMVSGKNKLYTSRALLLATGARHRPLGVPGEEKLRGKGVSYCAVCDGAFYANKTVAVVGGGNVALEDAIFLSRICKKVMLIHRRGELRGARTLQEQVRSSGNMEILWDTQVTGILGEESVEGIGILHNMTGEKNLLAVDGVFIAVGILPNSDAFLDGIEHENGFIRAGEDGATSIPGVYVAGDLRTKNLRQVVTAVADGANAVASIEKYLRS